MLEARTKLGWVLQLFQLRVIRAIQFHMASTTEERMSLGSLKSSYLQLVIIIVV